MTVLFSGPARDLSAHSFHFRDTTDHAAVDATTAGGGKAPDIGGGIRKRIERLFESATVVPWRS